MSSLEVDVEGPGGEGLYGLGTPAESSQTIVIPVPFEATVSYGAGTALGPSAILAASTQVDMFDLETGSPYLEGIAMLDEEPQVAAWNAAARPLAEQVIAGGGVEADPGLSALAAQVDALSERVNAWLEAEVTRWLDQGRLVGVVGGDHSVAYGSIAAHAARYPGMGLLHIDAHADLRQAYEGFRWSHASVLYNVRERLDVSAVVGLGYRDLCTSEHRILEDDPVFAPYYDPLVQERLQAGEPWADIVREAVARLPEQVYVTFDIDGLEPSLCPHTGTPVPGGLTYAQAIGALKEVVRSGRRIVGFDLVEVAPDPRGASEWDANVGARLLYKLIGFAVASRRGPRPS